MGAGCRYSCPAGSCVVFSEALCHVGVPAGPNGRLVMFTCYDTVASVWAKASLSTPSDAVMARMHPMRRTLYREVLSLLVKAHQRAVVKSCFWNHLFIIAENEWELPHIYMKLTLRSVC